MAESLDYAAILRRMTHSMALSHSTLKEAPSSFGKYVVGQPSRSARVEKSSSRNSSPKRLQRRKTVGTSGNRQVISNQTAANDMLSRCDFQEARNTSRNARPMSWHPSVGHAGNVHTGVELERGITGAQNTNHSTNTSRQPTNGWPYPYYHDLELVGDRPYCRSLSWEPSDYQTTFDQPLDCMTPLNSQISHAGYCIDLPTKLFDTTSYQFSISHQRKYNEASIAPLTTSLFTSTEDVTRGEKILVGLGLYDTSETPTTPELSSSRHPSTVSYHSSASSVGKGLKLEETWQPQSEITNALTHEIDHSYVDKDDIQLHDFDVLDPNYFHYFNEEIIGQPLWNSNGPWGLQQGGTYRPTMNQPVNYNPYNQEFTWPVDGTFNAYWMV